MLTQKLIDPNEFEIAGKTPFTYMLEGLARLGEWPLPQNELFYKRVPELLLLKGNMKKISPGDVKII